MKAKKGVKRLYTPGFVKKPRTTSQFCLLESSSKTSV